jgi:2,4-dienoyl-CoA reductase-like NADH-dependent reductase (Old Yellow Enzyme family)
MTDSGNSPAARSRPNRPGRFSFRTEGELRAKANDLGLDLPFSPDPRILLEPITISGRGLSNRLAIHPMEGSDADFDGGPGELTFRRYERFGRGGAGLIWFEAAAVVPEGRSNPRQLRLTPKTLDAFRRLVERTRSAARTAGDPNRNPFLILQLTHSGRFAKPAGRPEPIVARRDPRLDSYLPLPPETTIISDDALDALKEAFIATARLAARAGFDGVDIKACHGYLASELLSSYSRPGRYGGSYDHRTRFLLETLCEIGSIEPELLLAMRLNVWDGVPFPSGFGMDPEAPEREDLSEPRRLTDDLARLGVGLLNVTAGIPRFLPHVGRPFDVPIRGGSPSPEHPLVGVTRLIRLAGIIQASRPKLPIVGTGYSWLRCFFPNVAAATVASGKAALIGVGRLAFAYPDFARDLAERGRLNPRKVCTSCSGCSTLARTGRPAGCIVRDADVYRL